MADITKGRLIQLKSGRRTELPTLEVGEPAFCSDTYEFYIGSDDGNKKVVMQDELSSIPIADNSIAFSKLDAVLQTRINDFIKLSDIPNATTTKDGLMTKADKSKLNGISPSANFVEIIDSVTDTSIDKALSANQGKVLNEEIGNIKSSFVTYITTTDSTSTITTASTWDDVINEFARVVKI